MRDRLLTICAQLACRYPRAIIAVSLTLAVASAVLATFTLRINARTDDLIAPERPYMQSYRRFVDEFGDPEGMLVVVAHDNDLSDLQRLIARELDGENTASESEHLQSLLDSKEAAERCVDVLVERLAKIQDIESVHGFVSEIEKMNIATRKMGIDQLEELVATRAALPVILTGQPRTIAEDAQAKLNRILRAGSVMSERRQREVGAAAVLELRTLVAAHSDASWTKDLAEFNPRTSDRTYFTTSDSGRMLFIQVMPAKDFGSMAVVEEPLRQAREIIDEVASDFPTLEIGLTGKVVLQADEMFTTDKDMTRSSIIAIILVAILFVGVLGGFRGPGLALGSLLVAIAWNFGLTTIVIGQLNMLSMIFTLIQVGVGIDFGIHVLARFREERRSMSAEAAVHATLATAGRGNLTGALTSAAAFFMARFSHFEGLRELGFIAGWGLLLSFVSMTLLLPSLLLVFGAGSPKERLQESFFIFRPFGTKSPRRALILTIILTAILLPGLRYTHFEENVLELQAEGLESIEWEHRIIEESDSASWFGVVEVDSIEAISPLIKRAQEHGAVGSIHSILDVIEEPTSRREELRSKLNTLSVQEPVAEPLSARDLAKTGQFAMRLSQLTRETSPEYADELEGLANDINALSIALTSETGQATRQAMNESVQGFAEGVEAILSGNRETNLREVLPRGVRQMLLSPGGKYLVMLHPRNNPWDINNLDEFVSELRDISPEATGSPVTHLMATRDMREGFIISALLALACVLVLVWADFRSLKRALLAIFPLTIGTLWTVSAMGYFDVHFNLANFFSIPILIGIGVDSGIHILHRYREGGPERFSLGATRRGVLLTSLTSLIGFGCLAGASHRGLKSLGNVMLIGCSACLIASLIVLPAILAWTEQRKNRAGTP